MTGCETQAMKRPWRRNKRARAELPPTADDAPEAVVLGQKFAAALDAEAALRANQPDLKSPLGETYDFWAGETDLARFVQSPLDDQIRSFVERTSQSPLAEREHVRSALTLDDFYTLLTFARRSSVRALQSGDVRLAIEGLVAIALVDLERVDWRDVPTAAGLVLHALERVGGAKADGIRAMRDIAQPAVAELLLQFERPDEPLTLDDWGYREIASRYGRGFVDCSYDEFAPTVNIVDLAIDIADLIDRDTYRTSSITLADSLPGVWFPQAVRDRAEQVIIEAVAGVSLNVRLRPGAGSDAESQQFTVFLVETSDADAARSLDTWSREDAEASHVALSASYDRLFVLVVARSFVQGKPGFETSERLERFREPLVAALRDAAGTTIRAGAEGFECSHFEPAYHVSIEPEFPGDGDWGCPVISYGRDGEPLAEFESRWGTPTVVEVTPAGGDPWVGMFAADGLGGVCGVFACPSPEQLCVATDGLAYLVNVKRPTDGAEIVHDQVGQIVAVERLPLLLLVRFIDIVALGPDGIAWKTPRLAVDDLRVQRATADGIECTCDNLEGSTSTLTLDPRTGEQTSGTRLDSFWPPDALA